jgi:hypothetical protein
VLLDRIPRDEVAGWRWRCPPFSQQRAVLRQNSRRPENSAISCCDGGPIQVIPSPSSAKNLSRGPPPAVYLYILRMEEPGRFHDATLVRIRQPDRTGGAALPVAHEKGPDLRRWCEFFRLAFPSQVRDACGPRGSSEYTQRACVSVGVRQLQ